MDSSQSSALDPIPADRIGRRSALKRMTAMGAAGLTALGLSHSNIDVSAQDATPEPSSESEDVQIANAMFVQLAEGGTWTPKPGEDGVFLLSLFSPSNQTIIFSDRPERVAGTVGTDTFLDQLGFTPWNPPNAAAVVHSADGERDVLVVELFNPVYTRAFGADERDLLTYEARVLSAYEGDGLAPWLGLAEDDQLPLEFTEMSLFIDDCGPITGCCHYRGSRWIGPLPGGPYDSCYWFFEGCYSCMKQRDYFDAWCEHQYHECRGAYVGCYGC